MKPEKLIDAMGMIGDDLIDEENLKPKKNKYKKIKWTAIVAALLCISIIFGIALNRKQSGIIPTDTKAPAINEPGDCDIFLYNGTLAEAIYPQSPKYPGINTADSMIMSDTTDDWYQFYREMDSEFKSLGINMDSFYKNTCKVFLKDSQNKNLLYSPVNLYMALAMLAEISDGESRQQLLSLTEVDSIEQLRTIAKAIWKACYKNDGISSTVLANSLWLDNKYSYNQSTLDILAQYYYASSFEGDCGSKEFNEVFRKWINDQTNGLLEDNVSDLEITKDTVLTLASTIYFYAKWSDEFSPELTKEDTFNSPNGEIKCEFMNSSNSGTYFWGENFSAVKKHMDENGTMYFILPDEGYSPEDILKKDDIYSFLNSGDNWENKKNLIINLSVPKFDVSSKVQHRDSFGELGVTDIFEDKKANFANLVEDTSGFAAYIEHAVRVKIDEKGCEAAAYTVIPMCGSSMPPKDEIDFKLDRPFIFVITSDVGIPLFTGIVNNP
ncbi:MAG: hypothetical protein IKU52_06690 [Clostridia bacterium]|nr:hypothetical protein [Clostridia bacterium]